MTPIEKAEAALNRRLERIQVNMREAASERARQFLFQSLVICVGLGEALTDYVRMIGQYAQGRHGELKQMQAALIAQHDDLLKSGNEMLARLKADPADRVVRQEIERVQHDMTAIQKTLRRGADSLQRDLAPSMGLVDEIAVAVRRLGEADQKEALQRVIGTLVDQVDQLYRTQPALPAKDIIEAVAWEKSAATAIEGATDFYEAFARAGSQALLALAAMTLAVSPSPPSTSEEVIRRASESVAERLKAITARFAGS